MMKLLGPLVFTLMVGTPAAGLDIEFELAVRSDPPGSWGSSDGQALARRHGADESQDGAMSTHSMCTQVRKMMWLEQVANDPTKLQEVTHGNMTKTAEFKAHASEAAPKLAALQSNTTLMQACDQQFAVENMVHDCHQMLWMQKLSSLVANATALQEETRGNATKMAEIQAEVKQDAAKLSALESNTTLTTFCAVEEEKEGCEEMDQWTDWIQFSKNASAVAQKFHNNATKIAAFQQKMAWLQKKLDVLMANSTLMSFCSMEPNPNGGGGSSPNKLNSSPKDVCPAGAMVSLAALFLACVLLL